MLRDIAVGPNHLIDRERIASTYGAIRPHIRRTPVVEVEGSDFGLDGIRIVLKLESLQHAGSFKARGAFANLLLRDVPAAGVVAASGGNHGVAVAFAAMKLKKPARIFVPEVASPTKLERIRECGADLVVTGQRYDDALAASAGGRHSPERSSYTPTIRWKPCWARATVGLEFEEQCPQLDSLIVAVGGGGLIGGIAAWYGSRIKIIGVEPEAAPTLTRALEAGRPVDAEAGGIAADSLAPKRVGELMFPIAQAHVKSVSAGFRRSHPASPEGIVESAEGGRRTRRSSRLRGPSVAALPTTARRAGRRPGLRRQHHSGRLVVWCVGRMGGVGRTLPSTSSDRLCPTFAC